MYHICRKACGAATIAFGALLAIGASAARGGAVCYPTQDASATNLFAGAQARSESLDEMAGLEPASLPPIPANVASTDANVASFATTTFSESNEPRATVIPLPPAIWTGFAGLVSLGGVSVVRQLRRRG